MLILASSIDWLNYPGLELWKFANLAIFIAAALFLLRRRLSEALFARREEIKHELLTAREGKEKALSRVAEADALLARVEAEVNKIREQARKEAELERSRQIAATEREIEKLRLQAQREIEMARKVAWKELREFLANRSVELARESVRLRIRPEDDVHLISASLGELRRGRA
jgi:F0F1-type ATP synthase membrane subunit b/b'